MKSVLCEMLGIEFPLVAFSHCRNVVAAVSRAGGFGVLGATAFTPDELERELKWIDENIGGKPYGVDVLIPENMAAKSEKNLTTGSLAERIPQQHRDFVRELLIRYEVEPPQSRKVERPDSGEAPSQLNLQEDAALKLLEVSFQHPIKLIANALGVPPQSMLDLGHRHGVPVAALIGAKEHAIRQVKAGVDIIIAEGWEAGGHCSEVSTLVLIPEVLRAIKPIRKVPVLAAGGIATGRQMAACMALGAAGAWTGSVWLTTAESDVSRNTAREDVCGNLARHRQIEMQNREILAPAPLGVDRCMGRTRQSRDAADALSNPPQRTGAQSGASGRRKR